jgi:SAM-dependent methyltransferase
MTTPTTPLHGADRSGDHLPPNHHADYPGFRGIGGLLAALTFSVGRGEDAALAIALTGTGRDDAVVDVGCGPGPAVRAAVRAGANSAIGVDPAAAMLRVARGVGALHRGRSAVSYIEGTAERLPLADDSATVVWSVATVHHWRDVDAGLVEVRRVLRSGGRFLAIERRVTPGATGIGTHGWLDQQAEAFAERCRAAGFVDVELDHHQARGRDVVSVLARAHG